MLFSLAKNKNNIKVEKQKKNTCNKKSVQEKQLIKPVKKILNI